MPSTERTSFPGNSVCNLGPECSKSLSETPNREYSTRKSGDPCRRRCKCLNWFSATRRESPIEDEGGERKGRRTTYLPLASRECVSRK
ncbi:hypothetical protein PUN28_017018 [Cardiocondyla obscurior]|uniref:Uncharacterized protein n=1 Tax=Cardiocondyla obscurior TaxID=286306 RepID=A0AAW2EJX6_9HYME